jgi:hypothetical protein
MRSRSLTLHAAGFCGISIQEEETMTQDGKKQMGNSTKVCLGGVLLIGLAVVGGCGGGQAPKFGEGKAARPQALTSDCFQFPTSPYDSTSYYSFGYYPWLNAYCTTPDGLSHPLVHTAQDDKQPVGAPVFAAGNGTIVAVVSAGTCYATEMLVRHTLPDGSIVHTQYMHVNPTVTSGDVTKGQTIATVADLNALCPNQGLVSHLHFGVWNSGTITQMSYRGRLPKDVPCGGDTAFADQWINPNDFINSHSTCATTNATVNVAVSTGAGTVTVTRNGTVIGSTTTSQVFNFNIGDTFVFQASPGPGYTFNKFCGDAACSITTTSNPFSGSITASSGNLFTYFDATSPTCPTGGNWVGGGNYCWNEPGMSYTSASHLYNCQSAGGSAGDLGNCSQGCHNMPAGTNDICYQAVCPTGGYWYGAGLYCGLAGGMSNAAPNIVYYCSGPGAYGSISSVCGGNCVVAPPGVNDHC